MSKIGVPGHCWGLNGELFHAPGECPGLRDGAHGENCDRDCCVPFESWELGVVVMKRRLMMSEVAKIMEDHPEYRGLVFHRDVLTEGIAVLVAVFLSGAGTELGQHILTME